MNYLKLTQEKLSVEVISDLVTSPTCGATSIFVGTTRDNFDEKTVVQLDYEAYESMALKSLEKICGEIREKWENIQNIAVYHRLGTVPVKEASIVIAISSPHRIDAIEATHYCIDNVKKSVTIWKKEIYEENVESDQLEIQQVEVPYSFPHMLQIKASNEEIEERIEKFMKRKRDEINKCNVRDFCRKDIDVRNENSCARIDSVLVKRKDSKGHLQVNRVYNTYCHRDQNDTEYLRKYIPANGIEERVQNLESQLSLRTPVPRNIYKRLKEIEDRLIYLEGISPDYLQFWERNTNGTSPFKKKKRFTIEEIDNLILNLEMKRRK